MSIRTITISRSVIFKAFWPNACVRAVAVEDGVKAVAWGWGSEDARANVERKLDARMIDK